MKLNKFIGMAATLGVACSALATPITLTDLNSTALIDPTSSSGMYNWTIDGVNHLYQQWFWYRIGSTGPELSLDTLGTPVITQNSANDVDVVYTGSGLEITIGYHLYGGSPGSGGSDIAESIRIRNLGTSPIEFHFFQYSDFDLNGTAGNDVAYLAGSSLVVQSETSSGNVLTLSETSAISPPNRWEINYFPNILNKLTDANTDNLANANSTSAPGDVSWAFQWDRTISAGGSFQISKDKLISVPDSGTTAALLGAALTGLALMGRRFRR